MLSRPSSAIPSSSGSRFLIFHNSSNRSHNLAPKRSSALSLSLSPWSHPHIVLESRTSSCVRVARKIRCLAVAPAEPASELKRETSDTENVSLETQPSFDAGENNVQMSVGIGSPSLPAQLKSLRMSLGDQAFFALALIAGTVRFLCYFVERIQLLFNRRSLRLTLNECELWGFLCWTDFHRVHQSGYCTHSYFVGKLQKLRFLELFKSCYFSENKW